MLVRSAFGENESDISFEIEISIIPLLPTTFNSLEEFWISKKFLLAASDGVNTFIRVTLQSTIVVLVELLKCKRIKSFPF